MDPTPRQSHSVKTIFDIRYGGLLAHESNQDRVKRYMQKYGLSQVEVKLLMLAGDACIDAFGRIAE